MLFNHLNPLLCSRRHALGLAAGGTAAAIAGFGAPLSSARAEELDLSTPEGNLRAWVKLQAGLGDPAFGCGYFKGTVFGVVGQYEPVQPLFGFEGFGMSRISSNGDGTYQNLHKEVAYYTDLETGAILEEWANPWLDGEKVTVYPVNNDPVNSTYAPVFKQTFGDPENPQTIEFPFILPWMIFDDRAVVSFEVNTRWPNILNQEEWPREWTGPYNRVSEYFQIHAPLSELLDTDQPKVKHQTGGWQRIGSWLPWMLMEQRPGHLFYRTNTMKLSGPEQLPDKIRAYTAERFPSYLEYPTEFTEPNVTSFEVYKRDASPAPFPPGREPYVPGSEG